MQSVAGHHGSYELNAVLGSGGNGEVWRSKGPSGDVAVKLLKKPKNRPADAAARFNRELETLRRLDGVPGVLPLLDWDPQFDASPRPWYVMPLATTIRAKLGTDSSLSVICEAISGIAGALQRVHEKGICHRDIKPDNLYWYANQWCLGDFGLADFQDAEQLTLEHKKLGPAHYIAPEMLNEASDADGQKADIYSLGKTLWVLVTGQTYPIPGVHDPTYAAITVGAYQNDPRSGALDELLQRMTQLDPKRRPSAKIVAQELAILAAEKESRPSPDSAAALERLRIALAPHMTHKQSKAHQISLAESTVEVVASAIREILTTIENTLSLESGYWTVPEYWGLSLYIGGPSIEWEQDVAAAFEIGAEQTWRLGIGMKCQLLSNGNLRIHTGYHFDRLFHGREANTMGGPRGWQNHGEAMNGAPSSQALAERFAAELKANLSPVLDQFAKLISP